MHLADLAEEGLVLDRADPLALTGREAERLDDLRLPKGGRPLRLEGDLAEPDALRGRQDRVDLRLVGAGLLQADPDALGRGGRRAGSPKASVQRAAARAESSATLAL